MRLEVLIAVTMFNAVFWDMTACSLTGINDVSEAPTALIFRI